MKKKIGILNIYPCGLPVNDNRQKQPPVLLLLSGFPDYPSVWDALAQTELAHHYHIVKMAFPCMDEPLPPERRWGYSFATVRDNLLRVVQYYRETLRCETIYLAGHDWGSAVAIWYAQRYPSTLTKLIFLDVAPLHLGEVGVKGAFTFFCYQFFLALAFLLSRLVPFYLHVWFPLFINCYPWNSWLFSPIRPRDMPSQTVHDMASRIHPDQCYPYFQSIKLLLTSGLNLGLFADPGGVPHMLFIYGQRKTVNFHGRRIIEYLDQTPGCRQIAYPTVGHWMQTEAPERLAKDMLDFLQD